MLIFIPTLIICVNLQCEFQQTKTYYLKERECREQIELQKALMAQIASRDRVLPIIEGTCISADVRLLTS